MIIFNHFVFNIKFARHPEKYPFEKRYKVIRKEIRFVFRRFHLDYKTKNLESFYKLNRKCLIISNHLSDFDPLAFVAVSEKPITFVCKQEVFNFPFVGKVAKALECFPLDRKNLMNQISQIKNLVSYLKDENKPSVLVFIEGTRNKDPGAPCLDFHPGTLKVALMANVPLYLSSIYGSSRILDKKSYIKKYPVFFDFIRLIDTEEAKAYNTTQLAPMLQKETNEAVNAQRALDKEYINALRMSKKRKELETRFDISVNP